MIRRMKNLLCNISIVCIFIVVENRHVQAFQNEVPLSCGIDVVKFVLTYYSIDYNLSDILTLTNITDKGISFKNLKNVFESYGIEVKPRTGITFKQIVRRINRRQLAIVRLSPQKSGEHSHYFVIIQNHKNEPLLVNVMIGVKSLKNKEINNHLEEFFNNAGNVVLFLTPPKIGTALYNDVVVLENSIDLGKLSLDETKINHTYKLEIKNKSKHSIYIPSIKSTCNCIYVDWKGGFLHANEKKELDIIISPEKWGIGYSEKFIRIIFLDSSQLILTFSGTGVTLFDQHGIEVANKFIKVDIQEIENKKNIFISTVDSQIEEITKVKLAIDQKWLIPQLIIRSATSADLYIQCIDFNSLRNMLDVGNGKFIVDIKLSTQENINTIHIPVEFYRSRFFQTSNRNILVNKDTPDDVYFSITPENVHDKIWFTIIETIPRDIPINIKTESDINKFIIPADSIKKIHTNYCFITVKVESLSGLSETCFFILHLQ
jgi:hypothetical protein